MDLIPVDHDPFAPAPMQLTPVDHDPFAEQPNAAGMIDQANAGLRQQRLDVFRNTVQQREGQRQADQAAMMPETYANPAASGLVGGLTSMVADPVVRLIDEARNAPPPGLRREDYTDNPSAPQPGQELTNASMSQAMGQMGAGWTGGVAKAGETLLGSGPIRAYHGSPHDFERFSMDKIGTGEGAQAYGHGLYFAENEGVAKGYRDKLADTPSTAKFYLNRAAGDPSKAATDYWQDVIRGPNLSPLEMEQAKRTAAVIQRGSAGRMYKVDINADPAKMLDWDKPLQGQGIWEKLHPNVREAIDETMDNRGMNPMGDALEAYTGRELHGALRHEDVHEVLPAEIGNSSWYKGDTTEKRHTAEYLKSLDIPGIKFLDQGSRNVPTFGLENLQSQLKMAIERNDPDAIRILQQEISSHQKPSSNYVVFNDKLIDILKKYGIAGAAATGMAKEIMDHHQQHFAAPSEQKS